MSFAWLASFRLRLLFRGAFLTLAIAVLALAVVLLQEEKQRSHDHYRESAGKTMEQIAARLRHPAGQLALLNPDRDGAAATPGRPVVLPFAALDFDDQNKVRNAVEMSGCLIRYTQDTSLCTAIGNTPWAGGFIYVAGTFTSLPLIAHAIGDERLDGAHRLRVSLEARGRSVRWLAPFEPIALQVPGGQRGRFTGYLERDDGNYKNERPVREFRAWVWQASPCSDGGDGDDCLHKSFFSLRLPVDELRDALFQNAKPTWPPGDLDRFRVRIQVLPPGEGPALFDSDAAGAVAPFSLADLATLLLPGESLTITRGDVPVARVVGRDEALPASPLLSRLIGALPVEQHNAPVDITDDIATPSGRFHLSFHGDARSVNRSLGAVASRVAWFVGAMLMALALAWLVMEIGLIRPIARLTRRTRGLSNSVHGDAGLEHFELADLRGHDEMGLLAAALDDLLRRVKEDATRERIRTEQEKDMWHAVGHEIVSPLQSLLALHGHDADPSYRYVQRMQQAVRILYGSASPSEAFQTSNLSVQAVDIAQFIRHVAANAGVENLRCSSDSGPLLVRADEYSLEDVFAHIVRNADRHRQPGSTIDLILDADATTATVTIRNRGPHIPADMIDRIFEYGVSDQADAAAGSRGQGLFVARTYMAKMGGTVTAHNTPDGVEFVLTLRLSEPQR